MMNGVTVFHMTATDNNIHLLDFAISQQEHINLDIKTEDGWTPLQQAAVVGAFDALNLLLENGADPLCTNNQGLNIYDSIVSSNHSDLLEIFWNEANQYDSNRDRKTHG